MPSSVHCHLTINRHSNKSACLRVFELHDRMAASCQLSPPARHLGILLNRLILMLIDLKGHRSEPMAPQYD